MTAPGRAASIRRRSGPQNGAARTGEEAGVEQQRENLRLRDGLAVEALGPPRLTCSTLAVSATRNQSSSGSRSGTSAGIVALVFIVSGFVFLWGVGRFHSTAGAVISLVAGLVGRIAVVGAMTYSTLKAVDRGGWFIALAALSS
jgi:hypothetical protein